MLYLSLEDLKTDTSDRLIQESTQDFESALEQAEKRAIGRVKPFLRERYDVKAIFDPVAPLRDELLVEILSSLTLCKIFGRNALRKFSSDKQLEQVNRLLEKIASGEITLDLPCPRDENGPGPHTALWGSLRNDDFYL